MKSFLFSAMALLLLCGIVIWNSYFISGVSDDMADIVNEISGLDDLGELERLEKAWEKNKLIISLSVPHKETDELEKSLILLRTKFDKNIEVELDETVALTLRAIDEIKIHGTAKLDNIL